jgi:multiple sugar transport system ATP-binding protein
VSGVEYKEIEKGYTEQKAIRNRLKDERESRVMALHRFNLSIDRGELMVLVGPSGCGKSTALRLLAGLEIEDSGEMMIEGRPVTGLLPQQRDVAMVFQNYALYPHMTVEQNLAFPLKMRGINRQAIRDKVRETAGILDLAGLLERRPKQLSGGQRQRVAMGRALVRKPKVFLMDEPLSNLDAKLRVQIRGEIADLQRKTGTTTLYVTHDQAEAMTLGHRVAIINGGELQQVDEPDRLYDRPANLFVAGFLGSPGMNVFPINLIKKENGLAILLGESLLTLPGDAWENIPNLMANVNQPVLLGLRPEAIAPGADGGKGAMPVHVLSVESLGHENLVYFELPHDPGTRQVMRVPNSVRPEPGSGFPIYPDLSQARFFSLDGQAITT